MSESTAEQSAETAEQAIQAEEQATDEGTETLGDAGKQALDRMKADRNNARRELAEARAELENLRKASLSDQERAVEEARKEGESEATKRANDRIRKAETKALAATAKFRDPADAIAQLGKSLDEVPVDDDGEIDQQALKALIDDLAKRKPYLVDSGEQTATASDAGIGTRGDGGRADVGPGVDRMRFAYANSPTK